MYKGKHLKKKRKLPLWYTLLCGFLLLVFAGSGCRIAFYYLDAHRQQSHYQELAAMVEAAGANATRPPISVAPVRPEDSGSPDSTEIPDSAPTEPAEKSMLPEYAALYELNQDFVGWIKIEGTRINYPVMQTPENANYYLYRDFYRQNASQGSIYVREVCDVNAPSDNVVLFGHHMNDGSMFQNLANYKRQEYWEQHRYIYFDTLTEYHTYEIFAVFTTTATVGKGFDYIQMADAADAAEFDAHVQTCISLSFYDTGIIPQYGDKLLTLSTCAYNQVNGRLVVVAVRVN